MKRIDIFYSGQHYSLGEVDLDRLRQEIAEGVRDGPYWLTVNDGEGVPHPAYLLITSGVPIALVPVPTPPEEREPGDEDEDDE